MLPSILADKCYSTQAPRELDSREMSVNSNNENNQSASATATTINEENRLIDLVYNRLVELTKSMNSVTSQSGSCNAHHLYSWIRNMGKLETGAFVTLNQVLNALRKLEMRGLVYSCEDEFHYLPMIN